ncbi:Cyclin N-terminal domain-containing protein [Heracleum sosnowskyi]|uniref:Cyclin N-terminal domain-containing protein n=1 Tax=Heracleum sosnowskyi TaxID=360622 RepID=A0AAD8HBZ8_9APIA|nr:Cyclin N-terminal domain-containing protein [Heracleum sosnowskyi]
MKKSSETSFSLPSLFCHEDESCFNDNFNSFSQLDDEYIETLIQKETTFNFGSSDSSRKLKWARLDAIKWTFSTRSIFGFHIRTAYLSLTYFDRFISRRSIDNDKVWAIRLLAVACLSLAAKMEERKVPLLTEYYVDEYNFEGSMIQRMELLVLNALEWKLGLITPFEFIHYFITKFFGYCTPPMDLVSKAMESVSSIIKETSLMDHRPSVIAAAAVLAASDEQLTRTVMELKIDIIESWGSLEKEHIFSCHNLLVELEMEKCKTPKSSISTNLQLKHLSSDDVYEKSSVACGGGGVGTKRKLTYNLDSEKQGPSQRTFRQ